MIDADRGAKAVRDLINENGFKFTKSLGQNFLIDASIPEKIVMLSGIDESCGVLEVGPGIGALTTELGRAAGRVVAVELDRRLLPVLHEKLKGHANVSVIQGDILKLDVKELVDTEMPGLSRHVCANLPYNITTPTLTALIDSGVFETVTVMVQREVARRICAKPGSPDYGSFTVYIDYHAEPETLFDVPPECFMPRPKVHSSVVSMVLRKERRLCPDDEKMFFRVVRASFAQRRKTLANSLCSSFGNIMKKDVIEDIIRNCGLDTRARGETLGVDEFIVLSNCFKEAIKTSKTD